MKPPKMSGPPSAKMQEENSVWSKNTKGALQMPKGDKNTPQYSQLV